MGNGNDELFHHSLFTMVNLTLSMFEKIFIIKVSCIVCQRSLFP